MARKQAAPRWKFTFEDRDYILDVGRDLTFSRLLHVKQWYPHLGSMNQMVGGLINGDPEAWAAAIWCVRKSAGEADVPEPRRMKDFSIWDLMAEDAIDEDAEEAGEESADEGERPTKRQTSETKKTSKSSGGDISDS